MAREGGERGSKGGEGGGKEREGGGRERPDQSMGSRPVWE